MQDACVKSSPKGLRIQSKAIDVIHEGVESFIIDLYRATVPILVASKNVEVLPRHWDVLREFDIIPKPK